MNFLSLEVVGKIPSYACVCWSVYVCVYIFRFFRNLFQSCRPNYNSQDDEIWHVETLDALWPIFTDFCYIFKVVYWHWKFLEGVPLTTKKFLYENLWRNRENAKKVFAVARDRSFLP